MSQFKLTTPVAFVIFNRPDKAIKVFEQIRLAKPPKLLVIADGPRENKPGEVEKCQQCRDIIEKVDWDCEVLTNYSDINLGCRERPASGFEWVFSQVEEAIILEDDCVPNPTFFRFCQEMLEKFRDDDRILSIGGTNLQKGWKRNEDSYYFSRFPCSWGWASWSRSWRSFDVDIKLWPRVREERFLKDIFGRNKYVDFWKNVFQSIYIGELKSCWDYQWCFASFMQNKLNIIPNVNLVSNIGSGEDATHTSEGVYLNLDRFPMMFPLKHPEIYACNMQADEKIMNESFAILSFKDRIIRKLKNFYSKK